MTIHRIKSGATFRKVIFLLILLLAVTHCALPYGYNYFFNQFGSEAVTYEEGDEVNRGIICERAKVYAHHLMQVLLENNSVK